MHLNVLNEGRQQILAQYVRKADNILARLRGLLFSPPLEANHGLLPVPCKAVHCIGMTYSIDVVFIDKKLAVVGLAEDLKPGRLSAMYHRAYYCLELPAGVINQTGTKIGDQLIIQEVL